MNVVKSLAIVPALLITAAGVFGITTYSNAATDARQAAEATTPHIPMLPTIEVRPTPEQLRALRQS